MIKLETREDNEIFWILPFMVIAFISLALIGSLSEDVISWQYIVFLVSYVLTLFFTKVKIKRVISEKKKDLIEKELKKKRALIRALSRLDKYYREEYGWFPDQYPRYGKRNSEKLDREQLKLKKLQKKLNKIK